MARCIMYDSSKIGDTAPVRGVSHLIKYYSYVWKREDAVWQSPSFADCRLRNVQVAANCGTIRHINATRVTLPVVCGVKGLAMLLL